MRVGVYGRSGSGKTTWLLAGIRRARRVVVFDPLGEYAMAGFNTVSRLGAVRDAMAADWSSGFRVAYVPPAAVEPEALHQMSRLLIRAQGAPGAKGRAPVVLVVEEMNLAFPVNALPRDVSGFAELCSRGRHYDVNLIGASQRVAEVNARFRGNCNRVVFFPIGDHRDLSAALAMLGPEHRDALKGLSPHEYLSLENGKVTRGRNRPKKSR